MQVRTFIGPTTTEIMAQIKAELGPEAIILSSQKKSRNGQVHYEIMAALDEPMAEVKAPEVNHLHDLQDLRQEWSQLRQQLMTILKPQLDLDILKPRLRLVFDCLDREGVSQDVLMDLWNKFRRMPDAPILPTIASLLNISPWLETNWEHHLHFFIGPSGSGTSSILLRLALAMKKKNPHGRILVANADNSQGKGRLYLRHYAQLSNLDYIELETPEQWQALKNQVHNYDLILVDIPSLPKDINVDQWLEHLADGCLSPGHVHVVLSPVYSPAQMNNFMRKVHSPRVSSIIWTKLDEACNYGEILNQFKNSQLPISLFSIGPELKNTLVQPQKNDVWKLLLRRELPTIANETNNQTIG